jgi:hypothetical protein
MYSIIATGALAAIGFMVGRTPGGMTLTRGGTRVIRLQMGVIHGHAVLDLVRVREPGSERAIMHLRDPDRLDHRHCECYSFIVSDSTPFSTLVESHRAALYQSEPYAGPNIGGNISPTGQGFMVISIPHLRRHIPTAELASPMASVNTGKPARCIHGQRAASAIPRIPYRSDHHTVWRRTSRDQRNRVTPYAGNGDFIPDVFDMPYEPTFISCPLIAARTSHMARESHALFAAAARGVARESQLAAQIIIK